MGNNTGIVVSVEVIEALGAGKRPPVLVDVPADLAAAPAGADGTAAFFGKLSNSLRRYHVDAVNGARSPETRQRPIEKAVALFREGRQR